MLTTGWPRFFWRALVSLMAVWMAAAVLPPAIELALAVGLASWLARPWSEMLRWARRGGPPPSAGADVAAALTGLRSELGATQQLLAQANEALLTNTRLRAQEVQEQASLFEVSRAVTSTLQVERVLQEVVTHSQVLMQADGSALLLRRFDTLEMKASAGMGAGQWSTVLPMNAFSSGLTQFGSPHILWANASDLSAPVREMLDRLGFQAMLAMPLASRGNTVGVLGMYYRQTSSEELEHRLNLLATVGSQAAIAIENARLYEEQHHVTQLLRRSLAPRASLGGNGLEVGHRFQPSKLLSGDYYDVMQWGRRRFDLVIADVAGKGPDAAIHTARTKNIIEAYAAADLRPGQVLHLLNQEMLGTPDELHLVTVFYAQIDLDACLLVYANAGHEPAVMWRNGQAPTALEAGQSLIGVTPEARYHDVTVPVDDDTWLLLYTDGVTEARSLEGDFFGLPGVLEQVQAGTFETPQELVNGIYATVHHFSDGQIADDLSLLAVRIRP